MNMKPIPLPSENPEYLRQDVRRIVADAYRGVMTDLVREVLKDDPGLTFDIEQTCGLPLGSLLD